MTETMPASAEEMREAAAKVAEAVANRPLEAPEQGVWERAERATGKRIAAAIRALPTAPLPEDVQALVERLKIHAASWARSDCGFARDVEQEAALPTEAAAALAAAHARIRDLEQREARLREALDEAADQLGTIRQANDADDPDSYRADDREGCLDWTYARADEAEKAARAAYNEGETDAR